MCCNAHSRAAAHQAALKAAAAAGGARVAGEDLVAAPLPDGYWIEALPFQTTSTIPDIVAYGLGYEGKPASIRLFENPKNSGASGWKVIEIQSLEYPVGAAHADLTGDGYNDLIIIDRYGPGMNELWDARKQNGGRIQWLRNPGYRTDAHPFWTAHHIGNWTGMHRISAGHFTRTDVWQIMGFPIIPASGDLTSPAPIILFTPVYEEGKEINGPVSWIEDIIFPSQFRLIHDVKLIKGGNGNLDMILVAGREGIVNLWFNTTQRSWNHCVLGTGLPQDAASGNPYWGSGSVDVAAVDDDPIGYINSCEGFHGNIVSVYLKKAGAPKGPASLTSAAYWERRIIDNYGPLSSEHTGTIHNITTIDNGLPIESFGAACMGAPIGNPYNQGVYMYTPEDLSIGKFRKTTLTTDSASRLVVSTFNTASQKDVASITYYVPGYHTGPEPPTVRINTLTHAAALNAFLPITASKLDDKEVIVRLPRPCTVASGTTASLPIWSFAGKKLTIVVIPPRGTATFKDRAALKVVYGSVKMTYHDTDVVRGIAPAAHTADTTMILSQDGQVRAAETGAVVLLVETLYDQFQGPFRVMSDVVVTNSFPNEPQVDPEVREMQFPFLKVDTLDWASSGLWNDFEFYNMTGVYFFWHDDSTQDICHMQAWTLGIGETARFHNHNDKAFCEIHYCLSNGRGAGGMRYFPDDYPQTPEAEKRIQQNELYKNFVEANSTLLVTPSMYEHGPLWMIKPGTQATPEMRPNDTVNYPWHAWLASGFGSLPLPIVPPLPESEQAYDVWLAFEFPPSAFQF